MENKLNIAVIMGGLSSEKEISLESGRHIYNNLDREKYHIIPIYLDFESHFWIIEENLLWMNTTKDIENALNQSAVKIAYEDLKKYDFIFIGMHGKYTEDGCLQGLLEILDIPYSGSGVLASALGMNKYYSLKFFQASHLNVPQTILISSTDYKDNIFWKKIQKSNLRFPCIVKPNREGCSTALSYSKNEEELKKALGLALSWDNQVLVQEDLSSGLEITTTILGISNPLALLPTETPKKGEFLTLEEKFLPGQAQMITPPNLPKKAILQIQEDSQKAFSALGLTIYSRIDAFWKDRKLYILEANSLPGVTPSTCVFHQAAEAGMNAMQFFTKIIDLSIFAHKNKIGPL